MPFLAVVAASTRGTWRAVGDGAGIALRSWNVFTSHWPVVGQGNELARGLHDPGPLQNWLLAVPVHIDPVRGVLWGAALWCMAAASLAIEATWSVLGEIGGLLASGAILGIIAWMPALAIRPYWNPWFGTLFFLAALAAAWAVMSGSRRWWPILVITASIAAQAHLMFDVAAAGLVLAGFIVSLWDEFRGKAGYRWIIAGLGAGIVCWILPILQQFFGRVGNLTALVKGQSAGQHTGLRFAMKTLAAFTQPPPIWWQPAGRGAHLHALFESRPAVLGVVTFAVMATSLLVAVLKLRSRQLASLTAIALIASVAALVTFSRIPLTSDALGRLHYLIVVMFPVGLLIWLSVGSTVVLTCRQVILSRRAALAERPESHDSQPAAVRGTWIRRAVHGSGTAAAALIVLASLPGVLIQAPGFPADARRAREVSTAIRLIERALPSQRIALSVIADSKPDQYRVVMGLVWTLTAAGYDLQSGPRSASARPIPRVTVLVRGSRITVDITNAGTPASMRPMIDTTAIVPYQPGPGWEATNDPDPAPRSE
jgi:hypothetical protein